MAKKKPLRIGLIGYGFMGRTHSNAFRKVPNFFPELKYEPQLAAVCARNKDRAEDFAEQWGYESVETDWKKLLPVMISMSSTLPPPIMYTTKLRLPQPKRERYSL
jgi:ornithine cyclodeaminase/alanine dehydrogenase-like protein (mu-crystallin family)